MQAIGLLTQSPGAIAKRLACFALLRGLLLGLARGAVHGAPALELFDLVHVFERVPERMFFCGKRRSRARAPVRGGRPLPRRPAAAA